MTELPGQLADPGRYLRAQRELADVSRNTLARLAGVSESYLAQVDGLPASVLAGWCCRLRIRSASAFAGGPW